MRPLLGLMAALALVGCRPSKTEGAGEAPRRPATVAPLAARAELPECRRRFRIVTDKPLSLDEFSQLAAAQSVSMVLLGKDRLTLTYRAFDYEDHPIDGERHGAGVVYVRDERPGGPVAGGVIWASDVEMGAYGGYTLERREDGLYLTLTPLNAEGTADSPATCRGDYVVKLDTDRVLYADGVKVGSIQ